MIDRLIFLLAISLGVLIGMLTALFIQSHYDAACMDVGYGWAQATVHGVYCGRRVNQSFDAHERLDDLQSRAGEQHGKQEKYLACLKSHAHNPILCDPRFESAPRIGDEGNL